MLKALLRTLPSLSGNVKLTCDLRDFIFNDENTVTCNIRNAFLLPLSSNLFQKNIKVNLIDSSYEFDIVEFYKAYNNVFYSTSFLYDKNDLPLLDKYKNQYQRNTDFEFGVKRISYIKNSSQFAFFAPLWMEGSEDIPDYFNIKIKLTNESHSLTKNIKINLKENKETNYNYIWHYLNKYLSKIDDNIIYCTPFTNQATYYGISLKHGGLVKFVDNEIGNIYTKFNTILNFDYMITSGYKRNELVIRQIIPLCYRFNVNDFLNENERNRYKNCNLNITGYYVKDGEVVTFSDFESNYTTYYPDVYEFDDISGKMIIRNGFYNIFDANHLNTFKEKYFYKYLFSNKLSKVNTKWKLKYSSDDNPYIINLNKAYSINQNSEYKYGYFPQKYDYITGVAKPLTDKKKNTMYNLIYPFGSTSVYYNKFKLTKNKYKNILNNYCFNWYNILQDDKIPFNESKYWKTLKDNKVFYKGILYDLSNINNYPYEEIDKFGIFVNIEFNFISREKLKELKFSNYSINRGDGKYSNNIKNCDISDSIYNYNTLSNYNIDLYVISNYKKDNLSNNEIFKKAESCYGYFIDINDYGIDYYNLTKYYQVEDVVNLLSNNFITDSNRKIIENLNMTISNVSINGNKLLPIAKYNALSYSSSNNIIENYINEKHSFRQYDELFSKLTFGIKENTSLKYNFISKVNGFYVTNSELYNNYDEDVLYDRTFYLNKQFISYNSLSYIINNIKYIDNENILNSLNNIYEYYYYPIYYYKNTDYASDCFIKREYNKGKFYGSGNLTYEQFINDNDLIWVQQYNLNKIISYNNTYHNRNLSYYISNDYDNSLYNKYNHINIINSDRCKEFYCRFFNLLHLRFYNQYLHNDINNINLDNYDTLDNIYIKLRDLRFVSFNNYIYNDIDFKDIYISLKNILNDNYKFAEIYKNLRYSNTYKLFFFNEKYFIKENIQLPEYFPLYFKDKVLKLDENIYNLINLEYDVNEENSFREYKDLYLYVIENIEEFTENKYNKIGIYENKLPEIYDEQELDFSLKPYFNDVKLQDKESTLIYNNYLLQNLSYIEFNGEKYYKNNSNDLNMMLELPSNYIGNPNATINGYKLSERGTYDKYSKLDIVFNNSNTSYNYLNIERIYNEDKTSYTTFGYYLITVNLDNTSNTFSLIDEYGNTIKHIMYVNSNSIDNKDVIINNLNNMLPFIKANILNVFNKINTILYPKLYNYDINYFQKPILESFNKYDSSYTFSINTLKSNNNIYLLRYFDSITPLIKNTTIIKDTYNIKYKTVNNQILKTGKYFNNGDSILYKEDIDINKYNNMKIYNDKNNLNQISFEYTPVEYKHFNDNKYVNLDEKFNILYEEYVEYEKLHELEKRETCIEVFKNYINKRGINNYDEDKILFLFNKYEVRFETYPVKLNLNKSKKLYRLIYKFILL